MYKLSLYSLVVKLNIIIIIFYSLSDKYRNFTIFPLSSNQITNLFTTNI